MSGVQKGRKPCAKIRNLAPYFSTYKRLELTLDRFKGVQVEIVKDGTLYIPKLKGADATYTNHINELNLREGNTQTSAHQAYVEGLRLKLTFLKNWKLCFK